MTCIVLDFWVCVINIKREKTEGGKRKTVKA